MMLTASLAVTELEDKHADNSQPVMRDVVSKKIVGFWRYDVS